MALEVACVTLEVPVPPRLEIPNFGVMEKAWEGLSKVPSADELLCKFMDSLSLALAPVKRYLEMVEVFLAFYKCTQAIPDAILTLSPTPIFDCIKELAKVIAKILMWIPPIPYILMMLDLVSFAVSLIDEIITFFSSVDQLIDSYITILERARLIGDVELIRIVGCANANLTVRMGPVLDMLLAIKPMTDVFLGIFIKLLPGGAIIGQLVGIKSQGDSMEDFVSSFKAAAVAGTTPPAAAGGPGGRTDQSPDVPLPPIGDLLYALNTMRNGYVTVYNLLGPYIGRNDQLQARDLPTFQHL